MSNPALTVRIRSAYFASYGAFRCDIVLIARDFAFDGSNNVHWLRYQM